MIAVGWRLWINPLAVNQLGKADMRELKIKDCRHGTDCERSNCDQKDVLCEGGGSGIGQSTEAQNSGTHGDGETYDGATEHGSPLQAANDSTG